MAKKNRSKKAKAIATLVLSAIMLVGGVVVGYGWGTDWKYKKGGAAVTLPDNAEINNDQNSMQLSNSVTRGVKLNTRSLKVSEYKEYEIDTQKVEGAHVATVTLANHNEASDKSIMLSAEFASEYAKNFNVSDYIAFSSTTVQSGEEFTISCLQAFPYPITITATANGSVSANDGTKAHCTIRADYIRRFRRVELVLGNINSAKGDELYGYNFRFPMTGNYEAPPEEEIFANTEEAIYDIAKAQGGINAIFIESFLDDDYSLSPGTITEEIINVKIAASKGYDVENMPAQSSYVSLDNEMSKFDVSGYDYPLFFGNYEQKENAFLSELDAELYHNAGQDYWHAKDYYDNGEVTTSIWVQFTGKQTGITYTFTVALYVNPKYMYVSATGPSFDPDTSGGIIF